MHPRKQLWIGALLTSSLTVTASGTEPSSSPSAPTVTEAPAPAVEPAAPVEAAAAPLFRSFDLRSSAVRDVVRANASSQSSTSHRIEEAPRREPDLAAVLRERPEVPGREAGNPRLPERVQCDSFLSCGIESLLGLDKYEDQHERNERQRLMQQGAFTDATACEACDTGPRMPPRDSSATSELRPAQP